MSRVYYIEMLLTVMVLLTLYLFVLNRFDSLQHAIVTGVVIGLGMLTKEPYTLFLLPVLIWFVADKTNVKDKNKWLNLAVSILTGLLISSIWYLRTGEDIKRQSITTYVYNLANQSNLNLTGAFSYFYLKVLYFRQLYPMYMFLFAVSLIYFVAKREFKLPLIASLIIILFSFIFNKEGRFILPVFPVISLMISITLVRLLAGRVYIYILFAVFSLSQYFLISYGYSGPSPSTMYYNGIYHPDHGIYAPEKDNDGSRQCRDALILFLTQNVRTRNRTVLYTGEFRPGVISAANYRLQNDNIFIGTLLNDSNFNVDYCKTLPYAAIEAKLNNKLYVFDYILCDRESSPYCESMKECLDNVLADQNVYRYISDTELRKFAKMGLYEVINERSKRDAIKNDLLIKMTISKTIVLSRNWWVMRGFNRRFPRLIDFNLSVSSPAINPPYLPSDHWISNR